jgi:quinoprotein dehydrogenase-associated probable ABC transporter substrate-binding protein
MPFRRLTVLAASLLLAATTAASAQEPTQELRSAPRTGGVLRVCADPDNLPASNQKGEGYENKIAELLARTWGDRLEYAWWPVRRGFFSRALNGRYCDVAITAPAGLDIAGVTAPYYKSSYVIVYRKDSGLALQSLADTTFRRLKIGVHLLNSDAENTPPAMAMSRYGSVGNLIGFSTFFSEAGERPEDIFEAVIDRTVDVAIVWGPLAGYFVKKLDAGLVIQPVQEDSVDGIPFAYSMGMATRRRDRGLRDSLQLFIEQQRPAILGILKDFGIPTLPLDPPPAGGTGASR